MVVGLVGAVTGTPCTAASPPPHPGGTDKRSTERAEAPDSNHTTAILPNPESASSLLPSPSKVGGNVVSKAAKVVRTENLGMARWSMVFLGQLSTLGSFPRGSRNSERAGLRGAHGQVAIGSPGTKPVWRGRSLGVKSKPTAGHPQACCCT